MSSQSGAAHGAGSGATGAVTPHVAVEEAHDDGYDDDYLISLDRDVWSGDGSVQPSTSHPPAVPHITVPPTFSIDNIVDNALSVTLIQEFAEILPMLAVWNDHACYQNKACMAAFDGMVDTLVGHLSEHSATSPSKCSVHLNRPDLPQNVTVECYGVRSVALPGTMLWVIQEMKTHADIKTVFQFVEGDTTAVDAPLGFSLANQTSGHLVGVAECTLNRDAWQSDALSYVCNNVGEKRKLWHIHGSKEINTLIGPVRRSYFKCTVADCKAKLREDEVLSGVSKGTKANAELQGGDAVRGGNRHTTSLCCRCTQPHNHWGHLSATQTTN